MQLWRIFVMIRKLLNGDIDRVADIWLKTNLKAHYFISNQYWKSNYELVKEMMLQSEIYVFEADKKIQGFVGLNDEYIEGVFVSDEMQSCGIGKLLLDYIKDKKVSLRLNVYQKNARAISFYQREGFIIQCEDLDEATGEKEYTMLWKQKQKSGFVRKRRMKQKSKNAISIIGGADGPTSIFIAGHSKKQPLKIRIKNSIYRYKRKKVEKTIVANPHSLSETVQYAKDKYELTETAPADREYIEQIKCLKESLILQYKPELLGEMKDIPVPDFSNEASVKEYLGKIKTRSEMIAEMPDSIIPMDFHLYKIRIDDDFLEMEVDYTWNIFGMSYSGNNAVMKKFKKISRDLYSYYGVTEEDIKNKTKRYSSLVTNLSS